MKVSSPRPPHQARARGRWPRPALWHTNVAFLHPSTVEIDSLGSVSLMLLGGLQASKRYSCSPEGWKMELEIGGCLAFTYVLALLFLEEIKGSQ